MRAPSPPAIPSDERLIRLPDVIRRVGCQKTKIYKMIREERFPLPIRVDGVALWRDSEVTAWIAAVIAGQDPAA